MRGRFAGGDETIPGQAASSASSAKRVTEAVEHRIASEYTHTAPRDLVVCVGCEAWNKLEDQPWRIITLGLQDWSHGF